MNFSYWDVLLEELDKNIDHNDHIFPEIFLTNIIVDCVNVKVSVGCIYWHMLIITMSPVLPTVVWHWYNIEIFQE